MAFDLGEQADIKKVPDRTGAGSYTWDSGIYDCVVDMAYLEESKGGALGLHLTLVQNDRKLRESFYVTSGKSKGQKTYFMNQAGEKQYLPGFHQATNLCKTVLNQTLEEVANSAEAKTISVYDPAKRTEVDVEKKHVLTSLIGNAAKVGVIKEIVNKRVRNAQGTYVDSNEKREQNQISTFFYPIDGRIVNEVETGIEDALFIEQWKAENEGKTRDNFKEVEEVPEAAAPQTNQGKLFS